MKTKTIRSSILIMLTLFFSATVVVAGNFDWTRDLNVRADADPSGFRAQLSTRFKIGDAQVRVVLGNVNRPADAYMVFRLGEMSSMSTDYVLSKYRSGKSKGWGALAKSLGIKPGSREFHALKQGSDLYSYEGNRYNHKHGKTKNKDKRKKG
jgi:hypothetical protein